ncbi:MAG: HlyD family secretion protein [Armatimonadota bacterium]
MPDAPLEGSVIPPPTAERTVAVGLSAGPLLQAAAQGPPLEEESPQEPRPPFSPRRKARSLVFPVIGLVILALAAAGVQYWRSNLGLVRTDNAQTKGDLVPVSSRIAGTVTRLNVSENQHVTAGAVILMLDDGDHRLTVEHAKAQLAVAEAQVQAAGAALAAQQQEFAANLIVARAALQATQPRLPQAQAQVLMDEMATAARIDQAQARIAVAEANVRAAKATLDAAARTLSRDRDLMAQGAVAAQVVDSDTAAHDEAQARHQASQEVLRQARAELTAVEAVRQQVAIQRQTVAVSKAEIARAEAVIRQAAGREALVRQRIQELAAAEARAADATAAVRITEMNLERTTVRAPAAGWVTNLTAQVGQVVQSNQPLMALALARQAWVVANVKETSIGRIRIGDPVRITLDAYPGHVFHGRVQSIGIATGASTALLPPENATGNFVKVVQLVPVRIALTGVPDDAGTPLRIGLSAEVTIDTRQRSR